MDMRRLASTDLLLYWGLIGTIGVAHSLLLTNGTPWEDTTWFFIIMWACSLIIMLFCWVKYKEVGQFDYDEPLTMDKLYYVIGGFVATFIVSVLIVKVATAGLGTASIWVPQPHLSLSVSGMDLSTIVNDLFYQLALVSNSEESMVLAFSLVLKRKFMESLPRKWLYAASGLAMATPRAGWAILHAYQSYMGPMMPVLVLTAFISGLIISWCAYNKKVNSFLVAMLIHFAFNAAVILSTTFGLI